MAEKVQRIVNIINQIAPPKLAEHWDNVGLLIGDYAAEVDKVMVSLDVTDAVLDEAIHQGVNLIISHHPLIFRELKTIRQDHPVGRLVLKAIQHGIHIFAAHTNLDIVSGGINDLLVERIGLHGVEPLTVTSTEQLCKFVVYVPVGHEEVVRGAISDAGAGWIGNYSHCTFQTTGIGTFKPLENTQPFIGSQGELSRVEEVRLETIVPMSRVSKVIKAMLRSHPYEEVAYDLFTLANQGIEFGIGRIGYLSEPVSLNDFILRLKQILDLPYLRYAGDSARIVKKVALCGGSGSSYINKAGFKGADVYITGDVDFHNAQLAESLGLAIIDAGHYWTEIIVVPYLFEVLQHAINTESMSVTLIKSTIVTDPMCIHK